MDAFTYRCPVKVYFEEKAAGNHLSAELASIGENILIAYCGGSIKRTTSMMNCMKFFRSADRERLVIR